MIRHLVLFTLNDGVGHDDPAVLEGVRLFEELPGLVADVRSWEFARNITDRPIARDYAINCTVDDLDALSRYAQHPAHLAAVQQWTSVATWVIADYEI